MKTVKKVIAIAALFGVLSAAIPRVNAACDTTRPQSCLFDWNACGSCDDAGAVTACNQRPTVHLTIDDGPYDYWTTVLDILRWKQVKATFMVVGEQITGSHAPTNVTTILKRIVSDGHEIGCQAASLTHFNTLSTTQLQNQIQSCLAAVRTATGVTPKMFRPPYGECNNNCMAQLEAAGVTALYWNFDTNDYQDDMSAVETTIDQFPAPAADNSSVPDSITQVGPTAAPGAIMLMTIPNNMGLCALPAIIDRLRFKGWNFVSGDQCYGAASLSPIPVPLSASAPSTNTAWPRPQCTTSGPIPTIPDGSTSGGSNGGSGSGTGGAGGAGGAGGNTGSNGGSSSNGDTGAAGDSGSDNGSDSGSDTGNSGNGDTSAANGGDNTSNGNSASGVDDSGSNGGDNSSNGGGSNSNGGDNASGNGSSNGNSNSGSNGGSNGGSNANGNGGSNGNGGGNGNGNTSNGGSDGDDSGSDEGGSGSSGAASGAEGSSGSNATATANACAIDNGGCDMDKICTDNNGTVSCGGCMDGYISVGNGTSLNCTDINECAINNYACSPLSKCINNAPNATNPAPYTCTPCPAGYSGNGTTCTDINECQNNKCDLAAVCTNTPGSYQCACRQGFTGTGVTGDCININECATNNGGCSTNPAVACHDSTPTANEAWAVRFTCDPCPSGYIGDGKVCVLPNGSGSGGNRNSSASSSSSTGGTNIDPSVLSGAESISAGLFLTILVPVLGHFLLAN